MSGRGGYDGSGRDLPRRRAQMSLPNATPGAATTETVAFYFDPI
jgi:hypothetical protein